MSDRQGLIDTLRSISAALLAVRKSLADAGHLDALADLDTLMALAQDEAKRCLAVAIGRQRPQG